MPKQQILVRTDGGLLGQPNPINAPEGGLLQAENIVCDRENVLAEKRRGWNRYFASIPAFPTTISALMEYRGRILAHAGSSLYFDSTGTGNFVAYPVSLDSSDSNRMRSLETKKNLYLATSNGIYRNDALANTPVPAGSPMGLDLSGALTATSPTWFTNNKQVGYRIVFVKIDANQSEILGEPTPRLVLTNTSGSTKSVLLTASVPPGMVTGDWFEVHRTDLSADQNTDPGAEMFKLQRVQLTGSDISNRLITFSDAFDPINLGDPLYTNPSEETIDQRNTIPPYAADLAFYKGFTFFLNTRRRHSIKLQLLDETKITNGQGLTITQGQSAKTIVAGASELIGANQFYNDASQPTSAQNRASIAQSMCRVLNRDTGSSPFVVARYVSQPDDPPGIIEIQSRSFDPQPIYLSASSSQFGSGFSPTLPTIPSTVFSDNEMKSNRLYFSKLDQPDAVPPDNWEQVGEEDRQGVRILALQDSLIVLMSQGIWRLTGDDENSFILKPLDPTIRVLAKDAAVLIDNSIYCLSDQGIVRISENGIAVMSWTTETELKKIFSFPSYATITHAQGYASDRKYILWAQENPTDTVAKIAWVYNHFTQKWTTWRKTASAGHILKTEDKLYLAHGDDRYVLKERKSYLTSLDDFMDEDIPVTITAIGTGTYLGSSVTTATISYSYAGMPMAKGFWLSQSGSGQASLAVASIDNGGGSFTLTLQEAVPGLTLGAATVSLPIVSLVRFKPETGGNAGVAKFFSVTQLYLEDDGAQNHELGFFTDIKPLSTFYSYYSLSIPSSAGWGLTPWGEAPWGDSEPTISPIVRMDVPTQYRRCTALSLLYRHQTCREHFAILNAAYTVRMLTDQTTQVPR